MRNLDSGFPPPIRSRACFHGNDKRSGLALDADFVEKNFNGGAKNA